MEGDSEAVGGATNHYHRPMTNNPSWKLLVLRLLLLHKRVQRLLPLHMLVQWQAKGGGGGGGVGGGGGGGVVK